MNKIGLVLGGGGTKGAYQAGAIRALRNLGKTWDIVTGTSIGALNGAMLVQEDYQEFYDLWENVKADDIINGAYDLNFDFEDVISKPNQYLSFFRKYMGSKGADVEPLRNLMIKYFDKEKFMKSKIDYGCVAAVYPGMKPMYVNKKMMYEDGINYMLASSACFPIFPTHKIDDNTYIDGGYYDNLPIDYTFELGATEIIALDLLRNPAHPHLLNRENIKYIFPKHDIGPLFNFDKALIKRNISCGFNDVYKAYDLYYGSKYTFDKFDKPSFFKEYYLKVLRMESKISKMVNFKDDAYITNYFLKIQKKAILKEMDLSFGIIDEIMSMLNLPVEDIYTFDELSLIILEQFKDAFSESYEVIPSLSVEKLSEIIDTFDKVGIISRIINQKIYQNKFLVSEDVLLSISPVEVAIAQWIIDLVDYTVKL